jgi:hypothetical protein
MIKDGMVLLLLVLLLTGTAQAADLYLKDGGIIRCFFAQQQGEMVYVLINRDTEIELERRVVAIEKTFKSRRSIGSYRRLKNARPER